MQWIAPTERDPDNAALEKRLWDAANQLWAGAGLRQSEYSKPVPGLIEKFHRERISLADAAGGDFNKAIRQVPPKPKKK